MPMEFLQQHVLYSNKEKANRLNDFFVKQSTLENEDDIPSVLPQLDCQLNDIVLSVSEVSNAIQNLDKTNATGPEEVHNRLLIAAASVKIQPLLICLIFSASTLHQDSSALPLTQELYAFRAERPKHLDIAHFPVPLLLSGNLCLLKLDTFSQPLRLEVL